MYLKFLLNNSAQFQSFYHKLKIQKYIILLICSFLPCFSFFKIHKSAFKNRFIAFDLSFYFIYINDRILHLKLHCPFIRRYNKHQKSCCFKFL